MRTLILITVLFTAASFPQISQEKKLLKLPPDKRFITEYDKFKNITTVRSANFTVNDIEKGKLKLGTGIMLVLQYEGREPTGERQFYFVISGMSADGRQFDRASQIIALADDKRINLNVVDSESEIKQSRGLGILFRSPIIVDQKLMVPLALDSVSAFRNASKIEIQAGHSEFAVHSVALTIFKDIFNLVP